MLKKGAQVEAVIDVIEALDGEGGLVVSYPSDCREVCDPRRGRGRGGARCLGGDAGDGVSRARARRMRLMAGFAAVREAFQVNRVLAGLLG